VVGGAVGCGGVAAVKLTSWRSKTQGSIGRGCDAAGSNVPPCGVPSRHHAVDHSHPWTNAIACNTRLTRAACLPQVPNAGFWIDRAAAVENPILIREVYPCPKPELCVRQEPPVGETRAPTPLPTATATATDAAARRLGPASGRSVAFSIAFGARGMAARTPTVAPTLAPGFPPECWLMANFTSDKCKKAGLLCSEG